MILGTQRGQDSASKAKTLVLVCRSGTGGSWKKLCNPLRSGCSHSRAGYVDPTYSPHRTNWIPPKGRSFFLNILPIASSLSKNLPSIMLTIGNRRLAKPILIMLKDLLSSTMRTLVFVHRSKAVSTFASARPILFSLSWRIIRVARVCASSFPNPTPALIWHRVIVSWSSWR